MKKKLLAVMLGLSFLAATVTPTFAEKKEKKQKTKKGKKSKDKA